MNLKHRRSLCALWSAALVAALAGGTVPAAGAAGLEDLREEAQAVADEVTALERSLAALDSERLRLGRSMERADRDLAVLEAADHDARAGFEEASERYVRRAVEAYKAGAGESLALLLSAETLGEIMTLAQVTAAGAELDARALRRLQRARRSISAAEDALEERKARLLEERVRADEVASEIELALQDRRAALGELADRIDVLEEAAVRRAEARREAEARRSAGHETRGATPPDAGSQGGSAGFIASGVTFEGLASWYGPGFEGRATASGDVFHAGGLTAASLDLPLGTWLRVSREGSSVVVLVNDRGPFVEGRILDLSRGAAEVLGFTGVAWVTAEIVLPSG